MHPREAGLRRAGLSASAGYVGAGAAVKLALLFLLCAAPLSAQRLDPDWCLTCYDSMEHFEAGVGLEIAGRLVLPHAKPWQRVAVTAAISLAYEVGQDSTPHPDGRGYGIGPKDWLLGMLGAVVVEALWHNRE